MTVMQKKEHNPVAHLTPEDIENLGKELDAIRQRFLEERGEQDAAYIRKVIATQRKLGHNFTFVPFSRSVGAVMADPAEGIKTVADLTGKSIGVAGGPSGVTFARSSR